MTYLVESACEGSRTKQRIIENPGRKEKVLDNGDLKRFISSAGRHTEHALVLSAFDKGSRVHHPPHGGSALLGKVEAKPDR